ncbi:hypothetical protein BO71DRAFT_399783 [Aspergillus ellipticus CBS 707.79]|uniref:Uncharacterized protein n=1 Tax=Aspergillus ellipticus CBS 707.79 TaxID=1448320 RepID=A0A319DQ14_9EURO|nr:hypothetical protein BO71DRAFT_399783 [Aspergillus ellipticus CBS 707.79]
MRPAAPEPAKPRGSLPACGLAFSTFLLLRPHWFPTLLQPWHGIGQMPNQGLVWVEKVRKTQEPSPRALASVNNE